jgi:hypothetical protein
LSKLGELKAATGESWETSKLELDKLWREIEMVLGPHTAATATTSRTAAEPLASHVKDPT